MSSPSVASTLPPEILGVIFLEAQPKRRPRHQIPRVLILSHVCSHWREAAIGFTQLWGSLDIYSEDSIAWLPTYLDLSRPCLLKIRLDTYSVDRRLHHSSNQIFDSLNPIFEHLVPHIERVEHFTWLTFSETTVEKFRQRFDHLAAPALQHLCIIANRHQNPWTRSCAPRTIFNGGAPNLSLVDLSATWTLPRLESVTTLVLSMICVPEGSGFGGELLKIASDAPNLTHLCIDKTVRLGSFPDGPPKAFVFPSLRSLRLISEPTPLIVDFLRVLQAPQLESLWLGCHPFDNLAPYFNDTASCGGNKFPSLRYLTLQSYDCSNPWRPSNAFPTVTHLHLLYPFNSALNVTSLFSSSDSFSSYWPNLHTLIIQTTHDAFSLPDSSNPRSIFHQLRSLIPYRRQMNMRIKSVLLDRDLFRIAARHDWQDFEAFTMEAISPNNYHEYWWNLYESETLHM